LPLPSFLANGDREARKKFSVLGADKSTEADTFGKGEFLLTIVQNPSICNKFKGRTKRHLGYFVRMILPFAQANLKRYGTRS
jgi:hypothetical protein